MTKLRVQNFAVSLDGYAAGPEQDLQNPLGVHLGGGAATVRQYLQARLVDEQHLAVSPVLLGRGAVRRPRPAGAGLCLHRGRARRARHLRHAGQAAMRRARKPGTMPRDPAVPLPHAA